MTAMRVEAVLVAGVLAASAGCHESDVSVELNEKGTAVLAANVRLSAKFVGGGTRLAGISPALAILKDADPLFLRTPDEATRKELEKAGVKVLEQSSKRTDAVMSSKFRVQLQRLSALEAFARLRGGGEAPDDVPKESGLHLPVDALRLSRDAEGVYSLEGTFPTRASVSIQAGAVKDSGTGFADALGVGLELANDVNTFRLSVSMAVPGEIVDFFPSGMGRIDAPKAPGAKKEGNGKVVFTTTMSKLTADYMRAMKGEYIPLIYRVRFRLPKGKTLPADALWDGKPVAPKPPDPPKEPPPPRPPPK
jgi:hypothetical protein